MLGSLVSLFAFGPYLLDQAASLPVAIIIWEQYRSFLEWSLNSLANIFQSAGLAVIVFTIIIKTLLVPLTVQSLRSARAMQELQPKIKELQKKLGKDRQRLSQETMRLYSQHNVNPMAGCLPMLVQIPIFFGLYRAIFNLTARHEGYWAGGFLWLDNLAEPDPWKILPILAGVFQFVQTRMMRPHNQGPITDPQQRMMNQMMNFMPLMVVIFGWTFDSGPVLYWATQSIYSVAQQWLITGWGAMRDWFPNLPELPEHRRLGYRPPRDPDDVVVESGEDGKPVPQSGFMGWMQRRMEEAERQAAARREAAGGGAARSRSGNSDEVAAGTGTRPRKKTAAKAGQRARRGTPRRPQTGRDNGAADTADEAVQAQAQRATDGDHGIQANGQTDTANGAARPVVVPRKSRPARKRASKESQVEESQVEESRVEE